MDDASHVRSAEAEVADSATWLRDEEAMCSTKVQQPPDCIGPIWPIKTFGLHQ
jgi:hypothetical protein